MRFLSTPSARRATAVLPCGLVLLVISIHALREEGDLVGSYHCEAHDISIHALREEGDVLSQGRFLAEESISIHALREEGDGGCRRILRRRKISIHALREEGDVETRSEECFQNISIHALREEGDLGLPAPYCCMSHFYPRPPRGGRPCTTQNLLPRQKISIHALREEGDKLKNFRVKRPDRFLSTPSARRATGTCETRPTKLWKFLSTPSARRATADFTDPENTCPISIHALREEGDTRSPESRRWQHNFYPRPPRGGRPILKAMPATAS